jgi:hypothetical protein
MDSLSPVALPTAGGGGFTRRKMTERLKRLLRSRAIAARRIQILRERLEKELKNAHHKGGSGAGAGRLRYNFFRDVEGFA